MSNAVQQFAPPDKPEPKNHKRPLEYDPHSEIVRDVHAPKVIALSIATIWRLRKAGLFVPTIRLGKNSVGFRRADLQAWLAARTEAGNR